MSIAISNIGLVSCNGLDVVTSCASMRAGVSRSSDLNCSVLIEEELEEEKITGFPINGFTSGFQGLALYLKLANAAIEDMLKYQKLNFSVLSDLDLYICLPEIKSEEHFDINNLLYQEFPSRLASMFPGNINNKKIELFPDGHVSTLKALKYLDSQIENGKTNGAIIVSVDSLVNSTDIQYYASQGRLKTPNSPVGIMPGEAAVAMVVTSENYANLNQIEVNALIHQLTLVHDENNFLSDQPIYGSTIAELFCLATEGNGIAEFYIDLDGDKQRAVDWGHGSTILNERLTTMPTKMNCPSEFLGNTGAASAAIAVCNSIRSFARRYSIESSILILSNSESGERGAAIVTAV